MATLPADKDQVGVDILVKRHQRPISHHHSMAPASMIPQVLSTTPRANPGIQVPAAILQDTLAPLPSARVVTVDQVRRRQVHMVTRITGKTHLRLARLVRTTINRHRAAMASRTSPTIPNLVASKLQPMQVALVGSTVHPVRTYQAMGNKRLLTLKIPAIAHTLAKVSSILMLPSRLRRTPVTRVDMIPTALRHRHLPILALGPANINRHPTAQAIWRSRTMEGKEGKVTDSSPSKEVTANQVGLMEALALRLRLDGVLEIGEDNECERVCNYDEYHDGRFFARVNDRSWLGIDGFGRWLSVLWTDACFRRKQVS